MENVMYANAYKEVLVILNNLVEEDYNKIPKEYINFFEKNCNNEHKFEFDTSKSITEQDILEDTKHILFGIFEKFGASDVQKEKIKRFRETYYNKLEERKRELHNPDKLFAQENKKDEVDNKENNVQMIEVKDKKWYQKIFDKIKSLFK